MIRRLYAGAICAGLFTLFYVLWLPRLSRPMSPPFSWFFEVILLIGMAFGINPHSPGYGYLIPITFILTFVLFMAISLLFSLLRRARS
jgi:hypothetical protein